MNFKLFSKEQKIGIVTLHLQIPKTGDVSVAFPANLKWSRIWQSNNISELQMDVDQSYADLLTLGNTYTLS